MQNSSTSMSLFEPTPGHRYRCLRCYDLGVWLTPQGYVQPCPVAQIGLPHDELGAAAEMIVRATHRLRRMNVAVNSHVFDVARVLSYYTSQRPCPRQELLKGFFSYTPSGRNSIRNLQGVIEDLRRVWCLPVGSRKDEPSGYWIITDADDFAAWVERAKSAPITQLSTIHRVAKVNFPIFAEQLEFEFWNDVEPDKIARTDAAIAEEIGNVF